MSVQKWLFPAVFVLALLAGGCQPIRPDAGGATVPTEQATEMAMLNGTVTYLARIALPPGAEIQVQLQDTSRADAPADVLAEQLIVTTGEQVPIPFQLEYNPAEIVENRTYSLSVRITVDGQLRFINTTFTPVLTRGAPVDNVEVIVDLV